MMAADAERHERNGACPAVRVLGVDPGTRVVGYGILDLERGRRARVVRHGVIRLPPRPLSVRLAVLFRELEALIAAERPAVLSIEQVFHGKNFQSVLKVGEARGVVVLAAQLGGVEIHEYAPAAIKKAATGNGNAQKPQVARMMGRLLGLETIPWPHDVTDALAAAYCHAQRAVPHAATPARRAATQAWAEVLASRRRRRVSPGAKGRAAAGLDLESLLRSGKARILPRRKRSIGRTALHPKDNTRETKP